MYPQQQFGQFQQNTKGKGKGPQQPYKKQIFGERVTKANVADQRSNPWEDVSFGIGEPDLQHSEPSEFNSYAVAVALDQVYNGLQEELRQGSCCALFLKSLGSRESDRMGRRLACMERILGMDCSERQFEAYVKAICDVNGRFKWHQVSTIAFLKGRMRKKEEAM